MAQGSQAEKYRKKQGFLKPSSGPTNKNIILMVALHFFSDFLRRKLCPVQKHRRSFLSYRLYMGGGIGNEVLSVNGRIVKVFLSR
jgi:hypothetical protein